MMKEVAIEVAAPATVVEQPVSIRVSKRTERCLMGGCAVALILLAAGLAVGLYSVLRPATVVLSGNQLEVTWDSMGSNDRKGTDDDGMGSFKIHSPPSFPSPSLPPSPSPPPSPSSPLGSTEPSNHTALNTTFVPASPGYVAARQRWNSLLTSGRHASTSDHTISNVETTTKKVQRVPVPEVVDRFVGADAATQMTLSTSQSFGMASLELTNTSEGIEAYETLEDIVELDEETLAAMKDTLAPWQHMEAGAPQEQGEDAAEGDRRRLTQGDAEVVGDEDAEVRRSLGIIGGQRNTAADTRTQISCHNSKRFPFSTIVGLDKKDHSRHFCSGTLIAPDTVLTAGQCVHCGLGNAGCPKGAWVDFNTVTIHTCDRHDHTLAGWWPPRRYSVHKIRAYKGWTVDGNFDYDVAVIKLHGAPGWWHGWKSFGYSSAITNHWMFNFEGYPGDKPAFTMWHAYDRQCKASDHADCKDNPSANQIRIMHDLWPGHSGSGLYFYDAAKALRVLYGVVSYESGCKRDDKGRSTSEDCAYNAAARMRDWMFASICNFIGDSRVC